MSLTSAICRYRYLFSSWWNNLAKAEQCEQPFSTQYFITDTSHLETNNGSIWSPCLAPLAYAVAVSKIFILLVGWCCKPRLNGENTLLYSIPSHYYQDVSPKNDGWVYLNVLTQVSLAYVILDSISLQFLVGYCEYVQYSKIRWLCRYRTITRRSELYSSAYERSYS